MICRACGFEFSGSLALCPKCAEPWETDEAGETELEAEDAAGILDAVGEKLGDIASSVKKYAGEATEAVGDMAWRIEKKLEDPNAFIAVKKIRKSPKLIIIAGIAVVAIMLFIALFTGSDKSEVGISGKEIRGNITASDGKYTYILNIVNYKKGDKNSLVILTQGSSKIETLDIPVIADVRFGVLVHDNKIYYKDATEEALTNPYCVYDLDTKRDEVLFDAGENIVSFTVDDAGLYANKADGSFIMRPHRK